ncbi:CLUMA_CG016914, isoform A [Clunio marinus]|uniref:CLUMA_CG016914, isoform A n=1 Tax=Clunio marinus TaxID=568069 RepID=A0A1J1ITE3_9DIPT|nr:CLUMA_CG016914, isoform A [Clunio marinus]
MEMSRSKATHMKYSNISDDLMKANFVRHKEQTTQVKVTLKKVMTSFSGSGITKKNYSVQRKVQHLKNH